MLENMKTVVLSNKINAIMICDTEFVHIAAREKITMVNKLRM